MTTTETHCPYCSLQCGMRLAGRPHPRGERLGGVPGQPRRAVPQGLDGDRAAPPPGAADHAAGARPGHRRAGPGHLGRGAGPRRREAVRAARGARQRRRRGLRRRRADQREGLPAREVRPGRAGHQPDRLQRPLVHVVGRLGRHPRLRARPRPAVPAGRPRADRRPGPGRLQPRRDHAAGGPAPRRAAGARRSRGRRRPAAYADRGPRRRVRPAGAGHRPGAGAGAAAPGGRGRRRRHGVRRLPHDRLRCREGLAPPPGGRSGSSGSPASRPTRCGPWPGCSARRTG